MADAEQLDKINALHIERSLALNTQWDDGSPVDLLVYLGESWRREAALVAASRKRGAKAEAASLTEGARLLGLDVARMRRTPTSPPTDKPPLVPAARPHTSETIDRSARLRALENDTRLCPQTDQRHGESDLSCGCGWKRSDAPDEPDTPMTPAELDAYLAGETPEIPTELSERIEHAISHPETLVTRERPEHHEDHFAPGVIEESIALISALQLSTAARDELANVVHTDLAPVFMGSAITEKLNGQPYYDERDLALREALREDALVDALDAADAEQELHREIRAMTETFPFREASIPPAPTYRPPPRPASVPADFAISWADLGTPALGQLGLTIPDHVSPSQLSTMDTCPAQARLGRYVGEAGLPGIPLWGAIGGTAFHACVEEVERDSYWLNPPERALTQPLWSMAFHKAIAEEHAKGHGIGMDDWYASNRGRENYAWWLEEGAAMVDRYVRYRQEHADGRTVLILPDGRPAIELELNLELYGRLDETGSTLPLKVILDIVWLMPDGSLEIWDHKTKSRMDEDTIQLGTQAWALRGLLEEMERGDVRPWGGITARYFDARKGTLTDAFDPLERHPLAELELRYADLDDRRRNRPAVPRPSALCKACPMRWLCPAGGRR